MTSRLVSKMYMLQLTVTVRSVVVSASWLRQSQAAGICDFPPVVPANITNSHQYHELNSWPPAVSDSLTSTALWFVLKQQLRDFVFRLSSQIFPPFSHCIDTYNSQLFSFTTRIWPAILLSDVSSLPTLSLYCPQRITFGSTQSIGRPIAAPCVFAAIFNN